MGQKLYAFGQSIARSLCNGFFVATTAAALFVANQMQAQSFRTVTFTGASSDFTAAEKYTAQGTAQNVDYYVTFDANNLYIGAFRTNSSTFGGADNFTVYIDTDPSSTPTGGTGTTTGQNYNGVSGVLPFSANYNMHAEQGYQEARSFGSSWASTISGVTYFTNTTAREVKIPFTSIGSPDAIYLTMWMGYANGFYANAPGTNVAPSGNPTITGYFGGIGLSSADCIPINTVNLPITASITNGVPVAGATYGKVTVNTGTVTNANNWTLAPGGSIQVTGGTFAVGAQTITMGNAATSTGRGTTINTTGAGALTTASTSVFDFGGEGNVTGNALSISGTVRIRQKFVPLTSGGLTFANGSFLDIRSGGFVSTNAPTYAAGSTLAYNAGAAYGASTEWTPNALTGVGVPSNVSVGNAITATTLNFGASTQYRRLTGNLTIAASNTMALSTASGGDLRIAGNWTNNGTFTANSRAVYFDGSAAQSIAAGGVSFAFLFISNTGANVTAATAVTASSALTIDANARLDMATFALTLTGTTSTVNGFLRRGQTTDGALTGVSATTLTFSSTGTYEHNFTTVAGTIPTATWSAGSTCSIIGYTSTAVAIPASYTQSFSNFTWNCTGQTVGINLLGLLTTVNGNFNLASAGTGSLTYNSNSPAAPTLTIGGNCTINANFNLNNGTSTPTFLIAGNFSQTGGVISRGGSGTTTITFNKSTGSQTISQSGGSMTAAANWNFGNATTTNTVQFLTNVNFGTGTGTITSSANATTDFQTFVASGSAAYTASTGATLITANTAGINTAGGTGSVQVTGTKTFTNAGVNYTFNGGAAQVTGTAIGAAANIKNLTVNNSFGVTASAAATLSSTGVLTFTSGTYDLSTFDLTLTSGATISGAASTRYAKTSSSGQLKQTVGSSSVTFPVGNSAYNPISFTNTGTSDVFGIIAVDGTVSGVNDATLTVNRRWAVTEGTAGGSVVTPAPTYNSGEENTPATFAAGTTPYVGKQESGVWVQNAATASGAGPFTYTANSSFSTSTASYSFGIGKDTGLATTVVAPTITSFTVSPGSGTSGYVGSTITITGTDLGAITTLKVGGSGGTAVGTFTIVNSTTITFTAISASGTIYVLNSAGSATSSSSYTSLGYITTTGATNWNTAASWLGGAVPPSNVDVTIAHNLSIAAAITNTPVNSVTVNTGITATVSAAVAAMTVTNGISNSGTFTFTGAAGSVTAGSFTNGGTLSWSAAATLSISAAGTLTNNGTFTRGTGTVSFVGAATLNGSTAVTFNNVNINAGALTLTTVPTIDGTFTINGGNVSAGPIYTANSTLLYNTTYSRFSEWSATGVGTIGTTAGYPNNVTINAGTFTVVNGDAGTARAMNGNLLVNTGTTFTTGVLNAAFTVAGNVTTAGTGAINMSSSSGAMTVGGTVTVAATGSLALSSAVGGDIYVAGNFTNNGTFTHNSRAVFMNGSAAQTISGSFNTAGASNNIAYLILNNTSGGVTANSSVLISATTGSPLQLLGAGNFNIAAAVTVTMAGNGGNLQVTGGTRVINLNAATSVMAFTGTKTVTSTSSGLLSYTSTVSGASVQLSAGVDFGAGLTTIGNNTFLIILSGGFVNTNPVTYATGSTLSFRNGASYVVGTTDKTWAPGTSGAGVPYTVEVLAASTFVDVTDDRTVTNNVIITNGTFQNITAGKTITVAPAVTTAQNAVNLTASTAALLINGGSLVVGPTGGGNQAVNLGGGSMTVSSGTVTINGNLTRAAGGSTLTQTGGTIVIDGNSGIAGTSVASGTPLFRFASTTGTGLSMSAGTVRIVDPPHSSYAASSTVSVSLSNGTTAPSAYWISGTHTFEFGDGVSIEAGNSDGFVIDTWVSTHRIPLRNVTVNAGNGTGRWVNTAFTAANGTHIMGTLTINSGSEFRNTLSTAAFVLGGDIVTNGTLTSTQTITFQTTPANGGATTSGTVAQSVTGAGSFQNATTSPTASFTNIVFDNTAAAPAITFNQGGLSVSGSVTFTNGVVSIGGSNMFSLVGSATSSRTNGWLVRDGVGLFFRTWTGTGSYTFPIGDSNGTYEYSPVTLNLTANATSRLIGVRVTDASHPQMNTPLAATDFLSRYWTFFDGSSASLTGTISMTYLVGGDVNGTESLIKAAYYNGSTWATTSATPSSPTLTTPSATYSGLFNLEFTGRNNPGTPYTWNGNTDNSWNTATNWTPNGVPTSTDQVTIVSGSPNNLSIASSVSCKNIIVNGDFAITSAGTLTVTGTMTYTSGTATLDCASTFVYSSTSSVNIAPFNYGNLTASGGARVLPSGGTVGVCGTYVAGTSTTATGNTFVYNGTGAQTIVASTYNNLTIANSRGAANLTLASGTITVQSAFDVSTFSTSGTVVVGTSTIDLTSTSAQNIPAFFYYNLSNSGNGNRNWASTGTIDIAGAFSPGTGTHTITGSTVRYSSTAAGPFSISPITTNIAGSSYNNLIIAGSNGSPTIYAQTSGSTIGVNGDFTLVSGFYRIALAGSFATNTLNVYGNFTMSGGNLNLTNSGTLADAGVMNLYGNCTISGGTMARTSSVLNGSVNFVKSTGVQTLTYSGGSFGISGGFSFPMSVGNGTTTNTLQLLSNFTASSIAMTVQNNASIDFGTNIFTSTGSMSFTLAAGSTLITANTAGIASTGATGSVQSTGTRTFATTANYVYNGSAAQSTGTGLPATVNNLTFNNTAATTTDVTLTASATVAGTLALTSGKVDIGTNTITVSNSAGGAVTVGTGFIQTSSTGTLNRAVATGANTYLFPVGNGANYTPASYAFSANATAFTLNVRSVASVHPSMNSNYTQTDYIDNRYWVTSVTGSPTTYSYIPTYTFLAGDVVGSLSSIYLNKWNGTIWAQPNIQAASGTSLTTASVLDATTGSLNATAEWVGRFNPTAVSYTWNGSVDSTWGDSGNWTPTGVPTLADNVTISSPGTNTLNITSSQTVVNFAVSSTGTFTMASGSSLTVLGTWTATTSATPTFDCASSLIIASTSSATIPAWNYGTLNLAGGPRVLASSGTIGICGAYTVGTSTTITGSTINYNGSGAQTIVATNYEGLTLSNNRGAAALTLASGTIDVAGAFTVSASNYTTTFTGNTINFSSASAQTIPAFTYNILTNTGNGNRTWASSGVIDINATFSPGTGTHTITGSTVRYSSTSATTYTLASFTTNVGTRWYNNLEFVGGASTTWQLASAFNLAIAGNLSLTGSGNLVVGNNATANTMTVDGNVTMSSASRFTVSAAGGGVLNVGGNFVTTSTATPSLAIATGSATADVNITGNMTISNGQVNVSSTAGAAAATLDITGDLTIDNVGVLQLEGTASTTGTGAVTVGGNFTATSTSATIVDFGQGTNLGSNSISISGNFSKSGTGTFGVSGAPTTVPATFGFRFVKAGTQTYSSTGAVSDKVSYTVASGSTLQLLTNLDLGTAAVNPPVSVTVTGTLNAGTYSVTGLPNASTSSFVLSAAGTIQTANVLGLNDGTSSSTLGGLSATSTKTYNVAGNYVFNGSVAQNSNFPAAITTCSSLTVNNPGNTVTLNKALSVTSSVALNAGVLSLGSFNLTLSTSSTTITTTGSFSNSTMIAADGTGSLIKTYATNPSASSFTWPIGDLTSGADYSPVTISFTGTGSGSLGFRVVDAADPNVGSAVNYITRYWIPTLATYTTYSWNGSFTYTSGDVVGTESSMRVNAWDNANSAWLEYTSGSAGSNVVTVTSGPTSGSLATGNTLTGRTDVPLYYRAKASTDWTLASTWEVSTDPSFVSPAPSAATVAPNYLNNAGITIGNGFAVTLATTVIVDQVTIQNGGSLTASVNAFTVANGTGTDVTVDQGGVLQIGGTGTITIQASATMQINGTYRVSSTAAPVVTTSGTTTIGATGTYDHARDAGIIPTCTWSSGSTCLLTGTVNNTPTGLAQSFHHFTVNTTLGASVNCSANLTTILGDFSLTTNHATFGFRLSTGTTYTLTVSGNLNITNGILDMASGGAGPCNLVVNGNTTITGSGSQLVKTGAATANLTFNGNFTQNAGTIEFNAGGSSNTTYNFRGDVTLNGNVNRTNGGTHTVNFDKTSGTQNLTFNGTNGAGAILWNVGTGTTTNTVVLQTNWPLSTSANTVTVANGATLDFQDKILSGTNTAFTMGATATLRIGSPFGITTSAAGASSGNIQTLVASRSVAATGTFVYSGTTSQSTGNLLPSTLTTTGKITIANSGSSGNNIVTLTTTGTTTPQLNLVSGLWAAGTSQQLNITTGGTVNASGGDFQSGATAGVLNFPGTGTFTGNCNPYNVYISGGVNFGTGTVTIPAGGLLRINAGGFVSTNAPFYNTTSTLQYNTNTTYGRSLEWSATSGRGYPGNVQVSNTSTLNLGNGGIAVARACAGNLTVDSGSTLSMNETGSIMTAALTVAGNVTVPGTLSLSSSVGGDINVGGDWNVTGTFNPSLRAVFFNGSGTQNVLSSHTFPYVFINNSGTGVQLGANMFVGIQIGFTNGKLSLNNYNLSVSSVATVTGGNANSYAITNGTGKFIQTVGGTAVNYPIGTSAYNPLQLTNSGTSDTFALTQLDGASGVELDATKVVVRQWQVSEGSAGGSNLTVRAQWNAPVAQTGEEAASFVRNDSQKYIGVYNGSSWAAFNATLAGTNPYTYQASGITTLGTIEVGIQNAFLPVPIVSSVSSLTGYTGDAITITGTNMGSVTSVTFGGVAGNITAQSSTSLTVEILNGASGNIVVTNPAGVASVSGFVYLGYITDNNTDWNTGTTWRGGNVPPAGAVVTVNSSPTVNATVADAPSTLTVNASRSLVFGASGSLNATTSITNNGTINMTSGGTLSLANNGTLTNNATFTGGSGTLVFSGTGTINGSSVAIFNNLTCNGPTFLVTVPTINGTLLLNATGYVSVSPNYGSASILRYNSGGTYLRSSEWYATSGSGYPANVQISSNTILNLGYNGTGVARQCSGNLTIDAGSSLSMNTVSSVMTAPLTVLGDVTISGTIVLSSAIGGDLYVGGNWTRNTGGTFTHNDRAVFFIGSGNQTFTGPTGGNFFPYVLLNKPSGNVVLANDVTVTSTLTFITTNMGNIDAGSYNLIITNTATGAIDRQSGANGHVIGNLQRAITTGTNNYTFHVGTSTGYAPALLALTSVSGTGSITVKNTDGDHPQIATSNIGSTRSVNRYWNISNSGLTIASYDATFNYNSSDIDAGANTANFIIGRYASSTWYAATTGTLTSTSSQGTGLSTFGEFAVGECKTPNDFAVTGGGANCTSGSGTAVGLSGSDTWASYQLYRNGSTVGSAVTGTGSAISFGLQSTAGNYTVVATNVNSPSCFTNMSGTAVITDLVPVDPLVSISASTGATVCAGTSVTFTATPSNGGSSPVYQWYKNGIPVGTATNTYTDASPAAGDSYYVYMTSNATCITSSSATSNTFTAATAVTYYVDADGDGFGSSDVGASSVVACDAPAGYAATNTDCNDANELIFPGADPFCNAYDADCDGNLDVDGMPVLTFYQDSDGDGYGNSAVSTTSCDAVAGYVLNASDCNDASAAIRPGAVEVQDGVDNNCNGLIDEGFGPSNDSRLLPRAAVQSAYGLSCNYINGTLAGATTSPEATATCLTGEDVWYTFTAGSAGVSIQVLSTLNNLVVELQTESGTSLSSENVQSSVGNEVLNYSGLTIGQLYFVCVRNYNSNAGTGGSAGGAFQMCLKQLSHGQCVAYSNPLSLCDAINARFVRANAYVFNFTNTVTNLTYSKTVSDGGTLLLLNTVQGLVPGQTYNLNITAVYNLTLGNGSPEVITIGQIAGQSACTITMAAHPSLSLRTVDQCPNARKLNYSVANEPWICSAMYYEYKFTRVLPGPALPIYKTTTQLYSRFLNLATVSGLELGATYNVEIRPIFAGGFTGTWSTSPSCLKIIGVALQPETNIDEEENVEAELVGVFESGNEVEALLFPNPTNGSEVNLVLSGYNGTTLVKVIDLSGKVAYEHQMSTLDKQVTNLKLGGLSGGLYTVIINMDGRIVQRKLLVTN